MKFPTATTLVALAASTVTAQDSPATQPQSGPFALRIANAANASLNGLYLGACHAGAAIEGLCTSTVDPAAPIPYYNTYYFNYSSWTNASWDSGSIVWNLPINLPDADHLSTPLLISLSNLGSNVNFPLFGPGSGITYFGFTEEKKLFSSAYGDDSLNTPEDRPVSESFQLQNWYVCWGAVGGYYYEALAWVTTGAPRNPTCVKVDVVREDI